MKLFTKISTIALLLLTFSCTQNNSSNTDFDQDDINFRLSNPIVILRTVRGNLTIELYQSLAPNTVTRIINLIESNAYDGIKFHKVVPGFIIQTGDLSSKLPAESKISLKAEINNTQHIKGTVAMARKNSDLNSASTQFYISLSRLPHLDNHYTIFGQVIKGLDVLDEIKEGDKLISFSLIK